MIPMTLLTPSLSTSYLRMFLFPLQNPVATPGFGDRVFYETLLRQNPDSAMAQEWCVNYGVLPQKQAEKLFLIVTERKKKQRIGGMQSSSSPKKKKIKVVKKEDDVKAEEVKSAIL